MNPREIDEETFYFDSFAELRGWRDSHPQLIELTTPAEGAAFDACALVHAALALDPTSEPLRQALDLLVGTITSTEAFRGLSDREQARFLRQFETE